MGKARVLVIDADQGERGRVRAALAASGLETAGEASSEAGLALLGSFEADAILADPSLCREIVRGARARGSDAAVVARAADLAAGAEALRQGAEGMALAAPEGGALSAAVEKALETRGLRREAAGLSDQLRRRAVLVGSTREMQALRELVRRAGPTRATVLVQGEVGTGRSLVAEAVHEASPRRLRPLVRASCAGLSPVLAEAEIFGAEAGVLPHAPARSDGRLGAAAGGSLLLREAASLPAAVQVKLLRFLQHGEYERVGGSETLRADVRVVCSSTRDLAEEVRQGRFRDDLYYRLGVVSLFLPPLRHRKADIPALAEHFLARAARDRGAEVRRLSPGVLSALYAHDWPGNVLELGRAIEEAAARCEGPEIAARHLPPVLSVSPPEESGSILIPGARLADIEREAILRTLDDVGGSTARAARLLGVSVRKVQYKLREYRGARPERRRRGANTA